MDTLRFAHSDGHDFLATSGPFHEPLVGPHIRSEPEQHPNATPTRPMVGNYVTAGEELRDGHPLKPGELRDR